MHDMEVLLVIVLLFELSMVRHMWSSQNI